MSTSALSQITQTTTNYVVSLLAVFDVDFPGGTFNDNIKWRAFIWAVSEGFLVLSIAINYLPPRLYSLVFKFSIFIMMLDFFLCLIWLPIGVSKTYGFRTAGEAFTSTCMLCSLRIVRNADSADSQRDRCSCGVELDAKLVCCLEFR